MQMLILGGTQFLGRHLVDAALDAGHEVTLFNRGKTNPDLYPDVEKLRGDRDGDLSALKGRKFDVAIDVAGYVPRIVRASVQLLEPNVDTYVFISSISVHADFTKPGLTEDSPVAVVEDETTEDVDEHYGALKALCEKEVIAAFGDDRTLIVRPGLIVGPHDPTNRYTYWVTRVADGGRVLAPGPPDRPAQYIDVRDLAGWTIRCIESSTTGTFNATGLHPPITFADVLAACKAASGSDAEFVWVDDDFLKRAEVGPWMELPLWVPADDEYAALMEVNIDKAVNAGLTFRSPEDTARATLDWARSLDRLPGTAGLARAKETELLKSAQR